MGLNMWPGHLVTIFSWVTKVGWDEPWCENLFCYLVSYWYFMSASPSTSRYGTQTLASRSGEQSLHWSTTGPLVSVADTLSRHFRVRGQPTGRHAGPSLTHQICVCHSHTRAAPISFAGYFLCGLSQSTVIDLVGSLNFYIFKNKWMLFCSTCLNLIFHSCTHRFSASRTVAKPRNPTSILLLTSPCQVLSPATIVLSSF